MCTYICVPCKKCNINSFEAKEKTVEIFGARRLVRERDGGTPVLARPWLNAEIGERSCSPAGTCVGGEI